MIDEEVRLMKETDMAIDKEQEPADPTNGAEPLVHLDPASGVLGDKPLPDADASLFVLVVGSFKNADETQAARQHCVHDLEVLRARLFPKLRLPVFFLGAVFARRDDAADSLAQLASCPKAQKGTILESGIAGRKSHGGHH